MKSTGYGAGRCAVRAIAACLSTTAAIAATDELDGGFAQVPMQFEENIGQTDEVVRFMSRGPGYNVFLTGRETVISLDRSGQSPAVVRWTYAGSDRDAAIRGIDPQTAVINYFRGNEPDAWRHNARTWGKVRQEAIYPGVDVVYYGNQNRLEYDFVVAPGADPSQVRIDIDGADALSVAANGDLVMSLGDNELRQQAPVVYQVVAGDRRPVAGKYVLTDNSEVGFRLGEYDRSLPLVIDPIIVYSSYLGGSIVDSAADIKVDCFGYAYVTGKTQSTDFPTTAGAAQPNYGGDDLYHGNGDAFIAKFDPSGSHLVYATYIGGSGGDEGLSLDVDDAGNVYISGYTQSVDFPVTPGAYSETANAGSSARNSFVTKLLASGQELGFSTYLGGSGVERATDIAVGPSGNLFVVGATGSQDFPVTEGAFQTVALRPEGRDNGFVTKLAGDGSALLYSTYFTASNDVEVNAVVVDINGNAHIAGMTNADDLPITANALQPERPPSRFFDAPLGFVSKFNGDGTNLIYSSYFGGSGADYIDDIALHHDGTIYLAGTTNSENFPVTPGAAQPIKRPSEYENSYDAFVSRINAQGSGLIFSTYFGGSDGESAFALSVDASGNSVFAGSTWSDDYPVTPDAFQREHSGTGDLFGGEGYVTKLNPTGSLALYSSYLGTNGNDSVSGVDVDDSGDAYLAGTTMGEDFPTTDAAFQSESAGGRTDAFVMKITDGVPLPVEP